MTYHAPKSVDNYIGTFEAVLILHLYGIPKPLMAKLLNRGTTLIQEHLNLIAEFYKSSAEIKNISSSRGEFLNHHILTVSHCTVVGTAK